MRICPGDYVYTRGLNDGAMGCTNGIPVQALRPLRWSDILPAKWPKNVYGPKGWLVEFPDGRRAPWLELGAPRGEEGLFDSDDEILLRAATDFIDCMRKHGATV